MAEVKDLRDVEIELKQEIELEQHEPPYTTTGWFTAPKFGVAGSGGLEYELLPEAHDEPGERRRKRRK